MTVPSLTRRHFVAATAASAAAVPAAAAKAALPFILVGDWGRQGADQQTDVARQMGITAAAIGSQFTVSVGDNFYENGVSGLDDPQWQTSFEQIYTDKSLQTPWKIILGNHDYRGNVQAQLDYGTRSARWQLPARYYTETQTLPDGAKAAFFYLDTSPFIKKYVGSNVKIEGQDTVKQLAWLDAQLSASTAAWKIVIGHHPIYTSVEGTDSADHDQPDLIARLDPVLRKHDVKIYVAGHDHCLQAVKVAGVSYVVTGAGSETYRPKGVIRGGFASGAHGFMTAYLSQGALHYELVDMHGKVLYADTVARI